MTDKVDEGVVGVLGLEENKWNTETERNQSIHLIRIWQGNISEENIRIEHLEEQRQKIRTVGLWEYEGNSEVTDTRKQRGKKNNLDKSEKSNYGC